MTLDMAMDSQIWYQKHKQQQQKIINWTSSKILKNVDAIQKTVLSKRKDNPQNVRKYLQIIYVISDLSGVYN